MTDAAIVRFLMVGIANTAIGYGIILILHYALNASPKVANLGGYLIGALVSYILNHNFTFNSIRPHTQALPRFLLTVTCCFALNLAVLQFFLTIIVLPVFLAQALAVTTYSLVFFLISRNLVFRE